MKRTVACTSVKVTLKSLKISTLKKTGYKFINLGTWCNFSLTWHQPHCKILWLQYLQIIHPLLLWKRKKKYSSHSVCENLSLNRVLAKPLQYIQCLQPMGLFLDSNFEYAYHYSPIDQASEGLSPKQIAREYRLIPFINLNYEHCGACNTVLGLFYHHKGLQSPCTDPSVTLSGCKPIIFHATCL